MQNKKEHNEADTFGQKNTLYWKEFYQRFDFSEPSPFAMFCQKTYLSKKSSIIELGCGNGRDLLFFYSHGHKMVGVDVCPICINKLSQALDGHDNIRVVQADFSNLEDESCYDVVYARFTMHAINAEAASRAYKWAYNHLNTQGVLMIEVRSIKDDLYGVGTEVEKDAFFSDHYRRFIRYPDLIDELKEIGFSIEYNLESKGLAVFMSSDPVVIRLVARKR